MTWVAKGTILGDLEITETFVDFDGPRVFSCRSSTDQLYIAGWAQEGEDADLWLYLPISQRRLSIVRSGGLTLRSAFEAPEGLIYLVTIRHDEGDDAAQPISASRLEDAWLPEPSFSLKLETFTLPPAEDGTTFERKAVQEARARMRLMVKLPKYTRSEAPTKKIGELLIATQSLYDNVGLAMLEDEPPQAGRIPLEIAEQTATDLVGLSAASFVVEIASSQLDDLLGKSVFSDVTSEILSLLATDLEREALIERLAQLRPRGAKSFRNFVGVLATTGGSVTVAGASATLPYSARELSASRLETLSKILNNLVPEDIFEVRGRMRLFKADMDRQQFGVVDEATDTRYEGRVAKRALLQVDHATMNEVYDVVISEFRTFDEAVGERKPQHVLEQLSPADPEAETGPVTITRITESAIEPKD